MITSLHAKNFQSHEDLHVLFHKGINAFIGSSESGKSAILRSLFWLLENRPMGDSVVSHWICDNKNKKILGECSVAITLDSGWEVTRRRTSTENQYLLRSPEGILTEFNAVGKADPPEEILRVLNFTELNLSKQHDKPFLISETSGEVSRFLNKVIRLDIIDEVLKTAESERRRLNRELENASETVQKTEKSLGAYSWIEEAQPLVKTWERLQEERQDLGTTIEFLTRDLELEERYAVILTRYKNIIPVQKLLQEAQQLFSVGKEISQKLQDLETSLEHWNSLEKTLQKYKQLQEALNLSKKLQQLMDSRKSLLQEGVTLRADLETFEKQEKILLRGKFIEETQRDLSELKKLSDRGSDLERQEQDLQKELLEYQRKQEFLVKQERLLQDLQKQMPASCPVCGQPLRNTLL